MSDEVVEGAGKVSSVDHETASVSETGGSSDKVDTFVIEGVCIEVDSGPEERSVVSGDVCTVEGVAMMTFAEDGKITSVEDAPSAGDTLSTDEGIDSDEATSAEVEDTTSVSGGVVGETCAETEKTTSVEDTISVAEAVVGSSGTEGGTSVGAAEGGAEELTAGEDMANEEPGPGGGARTCSNKLNALGPPQISSGFPAQGILQFGDPSAAPLARELPQKHSFEYSSPEYLRLSDVQ